jgi:hypothetical protein
MNQGKASEIVEQSPVVRDVLQVLSQMEASGHKAADVLKILA